MILLKQCENIPKFWIIKENLFYRLKEYSCTHVHLFYGIKGIYWAFIEEIIKIICSKSSLIWTLLNSYCLHFYVGLRICLHRTGIFPKREFNDTSSIFLSGKVSTEMQAYIFPEKLRVSDFENNTPYRNTFTYNSDFLWIQIIPSLIGPN
jgi:hypothetical protein